MLHVLVIEDDEDTAATSAQLLRLCGHQVEIAQDGASGVQAVQAEQPDVVLLDLALPKMDGWQVAQQIRQLRMAKKPLLIAVSGYGHPEARRRSEEAGIDLHLIKPVDPTELEDLLKEHARLLQELKSRAENAARNARAITEKTQAGLADFARIREEMHKPRVPPGDRDPRSETRSLSGEHPDE